MSQDLLIGIRWLLAQFEANQALHMMDGQTTRENQERNELQWQWLIFWESGLAKEQKTTVNDTLSRAKKWKLRFQPEMASMQLDMGETSQPDENRAWDSEKIDWLNHHLSRTMASARFVTWQCQNEENNNNVMEGDSMLENQWKASKTHSAHENKNETMFKRWCLKICSLEFDDCWLNLKLIKRSTWWMDRPHVKIKKETNCSGND